MDYCSVKKGTKYSDLKDPKERREEGSEGEYEDDAIQEIYLMDDGELEVEYTPNMSLDTLSEFLGLIGRSFISSRSYLRVFALNHIEDNEFFGDIDFILNNKKSLFKGVFKKDSSFWAIRGEFALMVTQNSTKISAIRLPKGQMESPDYLIH